MSGGERAGVRVGELTFWRRAGEPFVQVERGKQPMHDWERIDDVQGAVTAVLVELEGERRESCRLGEQCADLGRRVALMELGA